MMRTHLLLLLLTVCVNECNVGLYLQGAQWAPVVAVGDIPTVIHLVPTPTPGGLGQQRTAPQPGRILVHLGKILIIKDYEMPVQ